MKIEETVAYWSGITDPDGPAEQAAVALAKEVQRLRKEASRYIEALVHYDAWFGDECGCSDDPCPITAWTFRDAIRSTVGENDNEFLCSELLTDVAAAILAMPEMQAIRQQLRYMADELATGCHDDVNHGSQGKPDPVRYWLSDHLPESVIDWVVEDQ